MDIKKPYRLIISGGGTGGHIFPAIAIANTFRERHPDAEILFIGAEGKMEMVRVPEAGYKIVGLAIRGLQRKVTLGNLLLPFRLISSYIKASRLVKAFKPDVVVGTGGYASGPVMLVATRLGIPALIQEQNSYAGITNKKLGRRVQCICVAYPRMDQFFPQNKVRITGNPVRKDILTGDMNREKALAFFDLHPHGKTLVVFGGSLGARTINESILKGIDKLIAAEIQVIWQTGKFYYEDVRTKVKGKNLNGVRIYDFLSHMNLAYAIADMVISRAGALSISEISLVGKPCILVPSPNVAEDHQTKNAQALVNEEAAIMIKDQEAMETLVNEALKLIDDQDRCALLSRNIRQFGRPLASEDIVHEIENLITAA